MIEVNRILKVPPKEKTRRHLREKVRHYLSENPVMPPARLEILEKMAAELLDSLEIDRELLDFTIVLLGNEIWRDIVASIPYNRRLLLLPQCLRNKDKCKGIFDDLGLICAGCNSCHLNGLLNRAEELGYTTLVAEGTTVAVGLIEEGTIDAVIGVSCMSVLHRSFVPVTRTALPGIGIPLQNNGCENTSVDYHWLKEEIEHYKPDNTLIPVSVSRIKNVIADYFKSPVLTGFFPGESETEQLAIKMMNRGGRRIRPLLAAVAYQAFATNPSDEIQKYLALAVECFHKASLVHDDIEDDEAMRYGLPALHVEKGIPKAINLGDFLVGMGYHLLSQMPIEQSVLANCFRVVSGSHIKLAEGQGEDISLPEHIQRKSVGDVIRIFSLKTGEAIKVSLLIGAVAGNAPGHDLKILESFSAWFGIAYQIRDDLNEFREENNRSNLFDFPFLLVLLKENMEPGSPDFDNIIHNNNLNEFIGNVLKFNIEEKAENYFRIYIDKCYAELDNLKNKRLRLALYGILGKVFKNNGQ